MDATAGRSDLVYSDAIAASRLVVALAADAGALERLLPDGWEVAPYSGADPRGRAFRGANLVVVLHEIHAVHEAGAVDAPAPPGPAPRYVAYLVPSRQTATGRTAHQHVLLHTADRTALPGRYRDSRPAEIQREHARIERDGRREVRERLTVDAEDGRLELEMTYEPGGFTAWVSAAHPDFPVLAAVDPTIERWYQEDVAFDVVRSRPLGLDRVHELELQIGIDPIAAAVGIEPDVVGVVAQPAYLRRVFVPASTTTSIR